MNNPIQELLNAVPQVGTVNWIGIRPAHKGTISEEQSIDLTVTEGIIKDHYKKKSNHRQVTLIQGEHLEVIAKILKRESIDPKLLRRNIVISGINLNSFKNKQFQIGTAILEATGDCVPCSRMEKNLGPGGFNAMRGHGGITARVIQDGKIELGDEVKLIVPVE